MRLVGLATALAFAVLLGAQDPPPVLTAADVDAVVQSAAASVNSEALVIAVTDRQGDILAIYQKPGAPADLRGEFRCPGQCE